MMNNTDLISRSALLENAYMSGMWNGKTQRFDLCVVDFEDVQDAPAVDAEHVRHGRWISDYSSIICSECRAEYSDEINCMNRDFKFDDLNYCPNCGAKMDAEVEG